MDLLQLQYFREAARREHITQAAEALHITQPTLSKAISRLERELDCPLFSREGKRVVLTQYGRALLRHTDRVFDQLEQIQLELDDMKEGHTGTITIGSCFPPREPPRVWDLTGDFMWKHPNTNIGIIQLPPVNLRQSLLDREIDVALTTMPIAGSGINWIHLYDEPVGVIIAKDHPLAKKEVLSLSDLHEFRFMCNDMNSDEGNLTRSCCLMAGFDPEIIYAASVPMLIGQSVAAGKAVSLISRETVDNQTPRGDDWENNVVFRPLLEPYCIRQYGIALLSNVYHSTALTHYLESILAEFGIHDHSL